MDVGIGNYDVGLNVMRSTVQFHCDALHVTFAMHYFLYRLVKVERYAQTLGECKKVMHNAHHATLREKRSDAVFQMRNGMQHCRRAMGVRPIVGRIAIKQLNKMRFMQSLAIQPVQGAEPGQAVQMGNGLGKRRPAEAFPFMETLLQKQLSRRFVNRLAVIKMVV